MTRSQPALSLWGSGGQTRPRGEVSSLLGRAGDGGGEGGVDVVVDHALPHRAVARELDDLDVALLETAEREDRQRVLVERRRADHEADALALEVLDLGHAGILGDAEVAAVAVDRGQHELQRLRAPFLGGELEHAFLREIDVPEPIADIGARLARIGARRATSLPAGSTRTSVPYLSLIILPTATAILKPAVPVS